MTQIKFSRVQYLPELGTIGCVYFVNEGLQKGVLIYTEDGFESYTPMNYLIVSDLNTQSKTKIEGNTLILDSDTVVVRNDTIKISPVFAEVQGNKLIFKV